MIVCLVLRWFDVKLLSLVCLCCYFVFLRLFACVLLLSDVLFVCLLLNGCRWCWVLFFSEFVCIRV